MIIFLCGFMGAGKSSLLNKIRNNNSEDYSLIDLDIKLIDTFKEQSIEDIIEKDGWEKFRQEESKQIEKICVSGKNKVVSLGGGAISELNLATIKKSKNTALIWLNTPLETCLKRISKNDERPLAKKGNEFLQDLFNKRIGLYKQSNIHLSIQEQEKIKNLDDLLDIIRVKI